MRISFKRKRVSTFNNLDKISGEDLRDMMRLRLGASYDRAERVFRIYLYELDDYDVIIFLSHAIDKGQVERVLDHLERCSEALAPYEVCYPRGRLFTEYEVADPSLPMEVIRNIRTRWALNSPAEK